MSIFLTAFIELKNLNISTGDFVYISYIVSLETRLPFNGQISVFVSNGSLVLYTK